ncbi:hypothetical protein CAEBREN_02041 [Caenorhabditis brenneri]|uniref:Uncharacterized protein n=1 Tax=Caenorhabditis brenneri TaxID=135651 RepID=G0MXD4_CAEBE|nr:hypothetical protein CAEBREN_02041 [Caenorhabditis brenneri]
MLPVSPISDDRSDNHVEKGIDEEEPDEAAELRLQQDSKTKEAFEKMFEKDPNIVRKLYGANEDETYENQEDIEKMCPAPTGSQIYDTFFKNDQMMKDIILSLASTNEMIERNRKRQAMKKTIKPKQPNDASGARVIKEGQQKKVESNAKPVTVKRSSTEPPSELDQNCGAKRSEPSSSINHATISSDKNQLNSNQQKAIINSDKIVSLGLQESPRGALEEPAPEVPDLSENHQVPDSLNTERPQSSHSFESICEDQSNSLVPGITCNSVLSSNVAPPDKVNTVLVTCYTSRMKKNKKNIKRPIKMKQQDPSIFIDSLGGMDDTYRELTTSPSLDSSLDEFRKDPSYVLIDLDEYAKNPTSENFLVEPVPSSHNIQLSEPIDHTQQIEYPSDNSGTAWKFAEEPVRAISSGFAVAPLKNYPSSSNIQMGNDSGVPGRINVAPKRRATKTQRKSFFFLFFSEPSSSINHATISSGKNQLNSYQQPAIINSDKSIPVRLEERPRGALEEPAPEISDSSENHHVPDSRNTEHSESFHSFKSICKDQSNLLVPEMANYPSPNPIIAPSESLNTETMPAAQNTGRTADEMTEVDQSAPIAEDGNTISENNLMSPIVTPNKKARNPTMENEQPDPSESINTGSMSNGDNPFNNVRQQSPIGLDENCTVESEGSPRGASEQLLFDDQLCPFMVEMTSNLYSNLEAEPVNVSVAQNDLVNTTAQKKPDSMIETQFEFSIEGINIDLFEPSSPDDECIHRLFGSEDCAQHSITFPSNQKTECDILNGPCNGTFENLDIPLSEDFFDEPCSPSEHFAQFHDSQNTVVPTSDQFVGTIRRNQENPLENDREADSFQNSDPASSKSKTMSTIQLESDNTNANCQSEHMSSSKTVQSVPITQGTSNLAIAPSNKVSTVTIARYTSRMKNNKKNIERPIEMKQQNPSIFVDSLGGMDDTYHELTISPSLDISLDKLRNDPTYAQADLDKNPKNPTSGNVLVEPVPSSHSIEQSEPIDRNQQIEYPTEGDLHESHILETAWECAEEPVQTISLSVAVVPTENHPSTSNKPMGNDIETPARIYVAPKRRATKAQRKRDPRSATFPFGTRIVPSQPFDMCWIHPSFVPDNTQLINVHQYDWQYPHNYEHIRNFFKECWPVAKPINNILKGDTVGTKRNPMKCTIDVPLPPDVNDRTGRFKPILLNGIRWQTCDSSYVPFPDVLALAPPDSSDAPYKNLHENNLTRLEMWLKWYPMYRPTQEKGFLNELEEKTYTLLDGRYELYSKALIIGSRVSNEQDQNLLKAIYELDAMLQEGLKKMLPAQIYINIKGYF